MSKTLLAWHFVGKKLRKGDPVPADGVTLKHDGKLILCSSGLHASIKLIDALQYATGNTICRVRCGGKIIKDVDKLVCSERTILWRVEAESLLLEFARKQALSVKHLWNMPPIVRQYLETGDETIRATARDAASDAARAAARDAVTVSAAKYTAQSAEWAAAQSASLAAGTPAAVSAWDAAQSAGWAAGRGAARDAAREMLTKMVIHAHKQQIAL